MRTNKEIKAISQEDMIELQKESLDAGWLQFMQLGSEHRLATDTYRLLLALAHDDDQWAYTCNSWWRKKNAISSQHPHVKTMRWVSVDLAMLVWTWRCRVRATWQPVQAREGYATSRVSKKENQISSSRIKQCSKTEQFGTI